MRPPLHCRPCRVTYQGTRYQIARDGTVRPTWQLAGTDRGFGDSLDFEAARAVRREAARQRRNRGARERHQVLRDLGLRRNLDGSYE